MSLFLKIANHVNRQDLIIHPYHNPFPNNFNCYNMLKNTVKTKLQQKMKQLDLYTSQHIIWSRLARYRYRDIDINPPKHLGCCDNLRSAIINKVYCLIVQLLDLVSNKQERNQDQQGQGYSRSVCNLDYLQHEICPIWCKFAKDWRLEKHTTL